MLSICLLASGQLGLSVLKELKQYPCLLEAVFTNRGSEAIINYCQSQNIPIYAGNPRKGKAAEFIKGLNCDVLLSVNYLFIIERDLIRLPKLYAINIHGSLLPRYRGRSPHVWAIINGEKETGITAHLIEEEVDTGLIIKQAKVPIDFEDTGGDMLEKFNALYPSFIFSILQDIEKGEVKLYQQDHKKALFFGKRTAEDGRIIWDWSRERIRNWIRAQARPYPGAFTYLNDQKIIIHKAAYDDMGFHFSQANGTILQMSENRVVVKTPNGALRLEGIEGEEPISFQQGSQFN